MIAIVAYKDPNAVLDYTFDWGTWLGSDTLSTSNWTVPSGITQDSATTSGGTAATIWLSGGTAGYVYDLINRITTAGGRTDDRTLRLYVDNM